MFLKGSWRFIKIPKGSWRFFKCFLNVLEGSLYVLEGSWRFLKVLGGFWMLTWLRCRAEYGDHTWILTQNKLRFVSWFIAVVTRSDRTELTSVQLRSVQLSSSPGDSGASRLTWRGSVHISSTNQKLGQRSSIPRPCGGIHEESSSLRQGALNRNVVVMLSGRVLISGHTHTATIFLHYFAQIFFHI